MNNIWTKKNNKLIMKSTTKNHVSNFLNLRTGQGRVERGSFTLTLSQNRA